MIKMRLVLVDKGLLVFMPRYGPAVGGLQHPPTHDRRPWLTGAACCGQVTVRVLMVLWLRDISIILVNSFCLWLMLLFWHDWI